LRFQLITNALVPCIKKNTDILSPQLDVPEILVAGIVAIALFVFLTIKPSKKLVDLLRLSIQFGFIDTARYLAIR
jgi:hypothetical protein